jgi:hypothetical protein
MRLRNNSPLNLGFVSPCIIILSNKSNQPDASIFQIYCSSFEYSSTCFGHPHTHHLELINCSSRLRFTIGTWWYQCRCRGRSDRNDHDQRHCYYHAPTVKPEAAAAVVEFLIMGVRTPKTCRAVFKRRTINLRD